MSERIPITVVIATLNEAPRLGAALDTVRWADEVIVADAGSTDNTADIARSAGARVLTVAGRTIGAQRNAAIPGARNPWILALDADEAVTPELKESLHRVHERLQNLEHVEPLPGDLLHHPYRDLQHHVMKVAKYSRWAADDLRARGRRTTPVDVLVRPFWRFVRDYVVFGGWRDGRAGFVVSVVSAFSVFCKYATLLLPGDQFPL